MSKRNNRQSGFTIVELMIATAVFSMVLLLLAVAITQVGRAYYRGSIINRVQNTTRSIIDEISQAIQFSSGMVVTKSGTVPHEGEEFPITVYCIDDVRYTFITGRALGSDPQSQIPHVLWRDTAGDCRADDEYVANLAADGQITATGQELLGENMRLSEFKICQSGESGCEATAGSWFVRIAVAYGDDEGFEDEGTFKMCKSTQFGGQFCAVSEMATGVTKRLP